MSEFTIADLGEELIKTRRFIWDCLPEPRDGFDVDEVYGLLVEGGFALCPRCVCYCHADELRNDDGYCQECIDVAALYKLGGML